MGNFVTLDVKLSSISNTMDITKDKQVVLQVTREIISCLWRLPLHILDSTTYQSNHLHQFNGKENAIKYLHMAAFNPLQDTWEKSVNRAYFNTWPGLTAKDINNVPKSEATIKGHIAKGKEKPVQQQPI